MSGQTPGAAPVIKGWCPGALRPMLSGDGYVVRIRPRGGQIDGATARALAGLARRHGAGRLELSARANLQIRGVAEHALAPLHAALAGLALLDADGAAEARRNVMVTPFWRAGEDAPALAAALEAALIQEGAPALPGKFGFAVDCGETPVLTKAAADIRLERGENGGLLVRADGAETGAPARSIAQAVVLALDLAGWFLATGGARGGRGRMRAHLAGGVAPPAPFLTERRRPPAAGRPEPGMTPFGPLVGVPFGDLAAETFETLAEAGALRLTPWRMLLVEGAGTMPEGAGLIVAGDDPLLRVQACPGAPGCLQARGETRALARALAPFLRSGQTVHVSGCAKGCAHSAPADVTLVATNAGFDLVRNGRAGDTPDLFTLAPDAARIAGWL